MSNRKRVTVQAAESNPVADEPLHVKYRPQALGEVRGQGHIVGSLTKALERATKNHAFLFTGPSGTGKTTFARIVASMLGVDPASITEVDAATNNGIDAMRDLTATLRYNGFGDSPFKFLIIDEAHALSKAAWQSILKAIEEPPPHVFWALCTTEPSKVPDTVRTRCLSYDMKPVRFDDIMDLLEDVCNAEKFDTPERHLTMVARACGGSPRLALVMLAAIADCADDDEVAILLETPLENGEVINLCRGLVKGDLGFQKAVGICKELVEPAESVRIIILAYLTKCVEGTKTSGEAQRLLDIMYEFRTPFAASDKHAPLYLALGNLLLDR